MGDEWGRNPHKGGIHVLHESLKEEPILCKIEEIVFIIYEILLGRSKAIRHGTTGLKSMEEQAASILRFIE